MAKVSAIDDALKTVGGAVASAFKGDRIHHSNAAIRGILNNSMGAGEMGYRVLKDGDGIKQAALKTFGQFDKAGNAILNEAGKQKLNYGKIAGSYIGTAAALRVASGGGAYKDKNGNTNLIGVPFV